MQSQLQPEPPPQPQPPPVQIQQARFCDTRDERVLTVENVMQFAVHKHLRTYPEVHACGAVATVCTARRLPLKRTHCVRRHWRLPRLTASPPTASRSAALLNRFAS